jgi:hypothetical protein
LAINHADPHTVTSQRQESRRPESHRHSRLTQNRFICSGGYP